MIKEFMAKRRKAKARKLLARLDSPHFDSIENVLSGERDDLLRNLRNYYVECRRIFMDSLFAVMAADDLANIIHVYSSDPHRPIGSKKAIMCGFPPWSTQADVAEAIMSEAEKRQIFGEVNAEVSRLAVIDKICSEAFAGEMS